MSEGSLGPQKSICARPRLGRLRVTRLNRSRAKAPASSTTISGPGSLTRSRPELLGDAGIDGSTKPLRTARDNRDLPKHRSHTRYPTVGSGTLGCETLCSLTLLLFDARRQDQRHAILETSTVLPVLADSTAASASMSARYPSSKVAWIGVASRTAAMNAAISASYASA